MNLKPLVIDSALGKMEADRTGFPVGVVRMDPDKSYAGIGALLQENISIIPNRMPGRRSGPK
jgi:hypothetical protein